MGGPREPQESRVRDARGENFEREFEDQIRLLEALKAGKTVRVSGPMPSPELLKAYAEIDPDLPHRLILLAEVESMRAHKQAAQVARAEALARGATLVALTLLGAASAILALFLATREPVDENWWTAILIPLSGVAGAAASFYFTSRDQRGTKKDTGR